MLDRFQYERLCLARGGRRIAGADEAGRGPLAGPVVAAVVCLPVCWIEQGLPPELAGLNDSKQLSAAARDRYFEFLMGHGEIARAVVAVEAETIDRMNILRASLQAMATALSGLIEAPDHTLVDGRDSFPHPCPQTPIIEGDAKSYSIAAASVLAKVTRDRLMIAYDQIYPAYGFARHKGYPTPEHLAALRRHGPCPLHRRSFSPLRQPELDLFGSG